MRKIIYLLVFMVFLSSYLLGQSHIAKGNVFDFAFTEPVETLCIILYNGTIYKITSYEEIKVALSYAELKAVLKSEGHEISDIAIICHNHIFSPCFSPIDENYYRWLKKDGFTGAFLLYTGKSKKIMVHKR